MARRAEINIRTALKDAGFKKAEKGLKSLRFQAHGLNSTLAKLGASVAVGEFARRSVQAAVKMETANAKLSVALNSVGKASALNGASIKNTTEQMSNLGFQGAATAEALANLVTITGSLEKAQSLMGASADAARYLNTGLADGAAKLGAAFGGSSKALSIFGIKLDKTLKPAEAFDKAIGMLNAKIGGQATAYAGTYSGKLQILAAKFEELQVQVGEKLLPYLVKLGDFLVNTGIPKLEQFFTLIANHKDETIQFATAIGTLALGFKSLATYSALTNKAIIPLFARFGPLIGLLATGAVALPSFIKGAKQFASGIVPSLANFAGTSAGVGQVMSSPTGKPSTATKNAPKTGFDPFRGFDKQAYQASKDAAAAAKAAAALAKKEAAAKLAALRLINADKRLAAQFDLNQIALANALKLNLTEKEKAAVQGLIALQDDGYKTEGQRMAEQEASLKNLIRLRTDLASIPFYSPTLAGQEKQMPTGTPASTVQAILNGSTDAMSTGQLAKQLQMEAFTPAPAKNGGHAIAPSFMVDTQGIAASASATAAQNQRDAPQITINVAGTVTSEQDLLNTIYEGLGNKLRGGAAWYQNAATG